MGVLESFAIDHSSGLPVWIQIKNRIAYLIGSGAFVPGDRLPTVRALAVDLDISYNTVNRGGRGRKGLPKRAALSIMRAIEQRVHFLAVLSKCDRCIATERRRPS